MLQGSLTLKTQVKYNEYTTEERTRMGRYVPKAARLRLLDISQLASYHEAYVVVVFG